MNKHRLYLILLSVFFCSCHHLSEVKDKGIEKASKYTEKTKEYVSTKAENTLDNVLESIIPKTTNIDDANKAFDIWKKIKQVNTEAQPIRGRYWQSAHFSLEYEVYFLLNSSEICTDELIEQKDLKIVDGNRNIGSNSKPDWFNPSSDYQLYKEKDDFNSLYIWRHIGSDTIYVYDSHF